MTRFVSRLSLVVLPLALLVSACGSPTTPTSTVITTTTTTSTSGVTTTATTETYNGTLASGGTNYHVFHTLPGLMSITLVSIAPSTILPPFGFGFGMWDSTTSTCNLVLSTTAASPGLALTGTAGIETDVCIKVWDPTPFDPSLVLNYQVTATHFKSS
jgi:hypothetical protein